MDRASVGRSRRGLKGREMRLGVRDKSRTGHSDRSVGPTNGRVRRRQLNPRQRQGVLLVAIAAVGLIAVFVLISGYVSGVSKQVGPKIEVLELTSPVTQYQPLTSNMLSEVSVPAKWAPRNSLRDPSQLAGLVAGVALPAGTRLQQGMLIAPPALKPGQQEIAIYVDPETGVAGEITPGSLVNIIATFQSSKNGTTSNSARVVVPDAKVLSVGAATTQSGPSTTSSQGSVQNQVLPVTFALTAQQVLQVSYAESFAQKVRLSLVAPGSGPTKVAPYQPGL
jgi:pilus assembly protein CpaB